MKLWRKLKSLFFRSRMDQELDEEMRLHLELRARRLRESGMSAEDAERAARRLFGNTTQLKETSREAWHWRRVDEMIQDIRYALRGFRKAPGFAFAVIGTVGLGLGINAAVFTVFNAYVLRPFPVKDSSSLYEVSSLASFDKLNVIRGGFSWDEYLQIPKDHPFKEFFGYILLLGQRMDGREVRGELVTGNFFEMLAVNPYMGRLLQPMDSSVRNEGAVVVLSYEIWQSRYGSDPDIVGKSVIFTGQPLQVVGVAPPGFLGVGQTLADMWIPMSMSPRVLMGPDMFGPVQPRMIRVVGHLLPGTNVASAKRDISTWAQRFPATATNGTITSVVLVPRATFITLSAQLVAGLMPVFVAFSLVLLIACANVSNLLLSRSVSRQREIGIRLSIGAGRSRLIRQLLTESVLLALPAALVGLVVSNTAITLALRWLAAALPPRYYDAIPFLPLTLDIRVFSTMILAAILCAFVFGLFPAIHASNSNIVQTARGDFSTDHRPSRLRSVLIGLQVAVSVLLLICAGVSLRGTRSLQRIDPGMALQNVLVMGIQNRARQAFLSELQSDPDVENIAAANAVPINTMGGGLPVTNVMAGDSRLSFISSFITVSPGYFDIFKIPISRGRPFTSSDALAKADVAIVSKSAADALWPGGEAIGRTVQISKGTTHRELEVIGVVPDVMGPIGSQTMMGKRLIYTPGVIDSDASLLVLRVRGNQEETRLNIDRKLARIDSSGVMSIQPMTEVFSTMFFPSTIIYMTALVVGVLALVMTISGVYSVVSYVVSQRSKEIGIRLALGASGNNVKFLVLAQVGRPALYGTLLGTILGIGGLALLASIIAAVKTSDWVGYLGSIGVVLGACAIAAFLPSRRAARVDPASTLRNE